MWHHEQDQITSLPSSSQQRWPQSPYPDLRALSENPYTFNISQAGQVFLVASEGTFGRCGSAGSSLLGAADTCTTFRAGNLHAGQILHTTTGLTASKRTAMNNQTRRNDEVGCGESMGSTAN